jgi:phenylpropionate dioxygenase-like ring-hydroxylating dioxygenase large terminal subunit
MSKKVSRRDFARTSVTSVAASAVAVTVPNSILENTSVATPMSSAAAGAAVARQRLARVPNAAYGGMTLEGRDISLAETLTPGGQAAPTYPGGWREGTTIPAEYYTDERHYLNDERFIADHFWLMADHESRIPKAGDYFVFEFGRGDSAIIVRDKGGEVRAHHNVCRHRGSRVCQHGSDNVRATEARPDGRPMDPRLSVLQLGPSGNTPVFRCPYHAWTYDLSGRLISFPPELPPPFEQNALGLHPCHVRTVDGFIFVNFSHEEPPDFDTWAATWQAVTRQYNTGALKVAVRKQYPTRANWKLVVENFRECYHCQPSHTRSYFAVHNLQFLYMLSPEQRARVEDDLARHGHAVRPAGTSPQQAAGSLAMGAGSTGQHLPRGFMTGSLDGKPVAPVLPARKEYTHYSTYAATGFSTSYLQAYDDHVACARFTPRGVMSTDVELFWLVHPDAKEKDVDVDRMMALWDLTYREDRWIVENNHVGILSGRYSGGQPYTTREGGPASFIKWYMSDVAPRVASQRTNVV